MSQGVEPASVMVRVVLFAGALLLTACGTDAPPSEEGRLPAPGSPPQQLEMTRGLNRSGASLASQVVEQLKTDAGTLTPPVDAGPGTPGSTVPPLSDSFLDRFDSFLDSPDWNGLDPNAGDNVDDLIKALDNLSPTENQVIKNLASGRLPESGLGARDDEVRQGRIGWYVDDLDAAVSASIERSLPLVAVFCENADPWCARLVADTMRCPAINRFAGHAVFFWGRPSLDETLRSIAETIKASEVPTIVFFSSREDRVHLEGSVTGFQAAQPLSRLIEKHVGPGGTESEAARLAREGDLFRGQSAPNACGESAPGI